MYAILPSLRLHGSYHFLQTLAEDRQADTQSVVVPGNQKQDTGGDRGGFW